MNDASLDFMMSLQSLNSRPEFTIFNEMIIILLILQMLQHGLSFEQYLQYVSMFIFDVHVMMRIMFEEFRQLEPSENKQTSLSGGNDLRTRSLA